MNDDGEIGVSKIRPIRDEVVFVQEPPEVDRNYTIRISTWVEGVPTPVKLIPGFTSKAHGMERLRGIGHSWDYNINFVGYLQDENEKVVGVLHIWNNTFQVQDLELKEDEVQFLT